MAHKVVAIKPVHTEFSTYDALALDDIELPMGSMLKVTLLNQKEARNDEDYVGQLISAPFSSLCESCFAYNPGSLCDAVIPQLIKQGVIHKTDSVRTSGFNTYHVYALDDKILSELY